MAEQLVVPPPTPKIFDYPGATTAVFLVFTDCLLFAAGRLDPSGGTLTISLLVVLGFIGTVVFCLFFTIPNDEITAAAVGGLVTAVGAVMAYWLARPREPPK